MSDEIIRTAFDRVQRAAGRRPGRLGRVVLAQPLRRPGQPSIRRSEPTSGCGTPRRCASGRSPAPTRSRRPTGSSRTTWSASRWARFATRRSATRTGRWWATARSSRPRTDSCIVVTALDTDLDHFRTVVSGLDVEIEPRTQATPQLGINGPRSRELLQSLTDADVSGLGYFRFWPDLVDVGGVPLLGLAHRLLGRARVRALLLARRCRAALGRRHGRRCAALRARGRRDDQDRVGPDLHRLRLLPARDEPVRHGPRQGDPPRQGRLLREGRARRRGAEPAEPLRHARRRRRPVPEYGAAVTKDGEQVGTLTSPCESPTLGKMIGLTVLRSDLAREGETGRGRGRRRHRSGHGRPDAHLRHGEDATARVGAGYIRPAPPRKNVGAGSHPARRRPIRVRRQM